MKSDLRKAAIKQNLPSALRLSVSDKEMLHNGDERSIRLTSPVGSTPWTPKSLRRAKTAIVYKQTLNDTLFVQETWSIFFSEWKLYFVSLQGEFLLLFTDREAWEQGLEPHRVIRLNHMMHLAQMQVDVEDELEEELVQVDKVQRLFKRKLMESDDFDKWLNDELSADGKDTKASKQDGSMCVLEFASYNQTTFELWSKAIRKTLLRAEIEHKAAAKSTERRKSVIEGNRGKVVLEKEWVTPGHDSRISMFQSEMWCNRVMADDRKKVESELRRLVAMENLVSQITSDNIALLVYQKVSRVHEMFAANSRRELAGVDQRQDPMAPEILQFFTDHLKRKYSVFLNLAVSSNLLEEEIRDAHEAMCLENKAEYAGVGGGGIAAGASDAAHEDGFNSEECLELYEKYRLAAKNYYEINYADASSAEEEDAIMHLPVTLHVALLQGHQDDAEQLYSILMNVKEQLQNFCNKNKSEPKPSNDASDDTSDIADDPNLKKASKMINTTTKDAESA